MIGYGNANDMYVPSNEQLGEAWSWSGQWGNGYEQVRYDCSGAWETYQQQPSWQAPQGQVPQAQVPQAQAPSNVPAPRVGSELLTDLRLAELKRLIDADAKALKASSEGVETESQTDSADCATRTPDSNEESPTKDDAASAHSAPQAPKAQDFPSEDGESLTSSRAKPSGANEKVATRAVEEKETSSACPSIPVAVEAERPPPPGLDEPQEECYVAIANFSPESRNYGEMPVEIGEEVFVSGVPLDGWIFGMKRYHGCADEGWLPAAALDMDLPGTCDEVPRVQHQASESSGGSGRRGRAQQQAHARAGGGGRKADGRREHEHPKGGGKGDDEEQWHQHGNWWSRQRHLKSDGKDVESQPSGHGRKGPSRSGPQASPAAAGKDAEPEPQPKGRRRGRRGNRDAAGDGGASAVAAPRAEPERRTERPARERPALTSMLNRLNKPLVAPASEPSP